MLSPLWPVFIANAVVCVVVRLFVLGKYSFIFVSLSDIYLALLFWSVVIVVLSHNPPPPRPTRVDSFFLS